MISHTHLSAIGKVTRTHPRLLAVLRVGGDKAAMALVNLDEFLDEGLNGLWRRGTASYKT
jgi:hypothetical protein